MRSVVIGGAGQDGKLLVPLLKKYGYEVFSITRNSIFHLSSSGESYLRPNKGLENASFCNEIFGEFKPDLVFHLAAIHGPSTSGVNESINFLPLMRACHIQTTINILEWMKQYSTGSKLIYPLTSQLYEPTDFPTRINELSLPNPTNLYAKTKLEAWNLINNYRTSYNLWVACAILFRHTSEHAKPQFLFPSLVEKVLDSLKQKNNYIDIIDPITPLSICSADDIVEGLYRLTLLEQGEDFVLGDDIGFTIKDLLEAFWGNLKIANKDLIFSPSVLDSRKPFLLPDITKVKTLIGWQPKSTPLQIFTRIFLVKTGMNPTNFALSP